MQALSEICISHGNEIVYGEFYNDETVTGMNIQTNYLWQLNMRNFMSTATHDTSEVYNHIF